MVNPIAVPAAPDAPIVGQQPVKPAPAPDPDPAPAPTREEAESEEERKRRLAEGKAGAEIQAWNAKKREFENRENREEKTGEVTFGPADKPQRQLKVVYTDAGLGVKFAQEGRSTFDISIKEAKEARDKAKEEFTPKGAKEWLRAKASLKGMRPIMHAEKDKTLAARFEATDGEPNVAILGGFKFNMTRINAGTPPDTYSYFKYSLAHPGQREGLAGVLGVPYSDAKDFDQRLAEKYFEQLKPTSVTCTAKDGAEVEMNPRVAMMERLFLRQKSRELLASRHTPSDIQGIEFQGNAVGAAGAVPPEFDSKKSKNGMNKGL